LYFLGNNWRNVRARSQRLAEAPKREFRSSDKESQRLYQRMDTLRHHEEGKETKEREVILVVE